MSYKPETPFDNLESSHDYVAVLCEAIEEATRDVEGQIALLREDDARRKEALQLVSFKLAKLNSHMSSSRLILNDLRTLRRLLLGERKPLAHKSGA